MRPWWRLIGALVLGALLAGVWLGGVRAGHVVSGSMASGIPTGSAVLTVPASSPSPGKVYVYVNDAGQKVMHRLVGATDSGLLFHGDANVTTDSPVNRSQVTARVVLAVPGTGWAVDAGARAGLVYGVFALGCVGAAAAQQRKRSQLPSSIRDRASMSSASS